MAGLWSQGQALCPHDYYLKLCQLSGRFLTALEGFEIVLVDEAQDLSPVMLHVLRDSTKRLFVVGDTHQQIYAFRYAVDAMEALTGDVDVDLTRSFRFGQPIADLASLLVREAKDLRRFEILGSPEVQSTVVVYRGKPHRPAGGGQVAYIGCQRSPRGFAPRSSAIVVFAVGPRLAAILLAFHSCPW